MHFQSTTGTPALCSCLFPTCQIAFAQSQSNRRGRKPYASNNGDRDLGSTFDLSPYGRKLQNRSIVKTCSTRCSCGRRPWLWKQASSHSKPDDSIFASPHTQGRFPYWPDALLLKSFNRRREEPESRRESAGTPFGIRICRSWLQMART